LIGKSVAHYKIVEQIGEGGMGVVYRAEDSKLGRDVALKVLPDIFVADAERMARFQREAQVLASLNHPHIGAIYGLEQHEDASALVLELVEGPTLEDRIRQGPLPIDDALTISHEMADALEAAHERGIVHRDLKPSNVKFTADGKVKVLDFGLAKALESEKDKKGSAVVSQSPTITGHLTGASVLLGTAAYMSPEQARGTEVDKRSDIWAFGVILFEMLTGTRLFSGGTISDTLASVLKTDPDWDSLPENTPPRMRWMLRRCLQRDPRQRLRDIGDARIAIEETRSGTPEDLVVPAEPDAIATKKRMPLIPMVAVAALVAAIVGAAVGALFPSGSDLPLRKSAIDMDPTDASLGAAFEPRLSPDGSTLAYLSQGRLWVRDLDDLHSRELPGTDGARKPFWSPDGAWIGYGAGRSLWKVPSGGGEPVQIATFPSSEVFRNASGGWWGPDGRIVICFGDGGLLEVSAQGGDLESILEPGETETDLHDVSGLPDGRGWIFIIHGEDGGFSTLGLLSKDGTRKDVLTLEDQNLFDPYYSPTGHILFERRPTTSGIWALPFDLRSLEADGEPFLVAADATVASAGAGGAITYVQGVVTRQSQLVWLDRSGELLGSIGEPSTYLPFATLSPDDERLLVRTGEADARDLWIYDTVRGTQSRLTFSEDVDQMGSWSPDGSIIYHQAATDSGFMIHRSRADGTGEAEFLYRGINPQITRDNRFLLFAQSKGGNNADWDLFYRRLDQEDAEPVVFLATSAAELAAYPSPEGRHVAYVSDESGRTEVYVTAFPDRQGKWQVSTGGGHWPVWSRDGREILFTNGDEILSVEVETRPQIRLGRSRVLFKRPMSGWSLPWPEGFAVSADAQRFVVFSPAQDEGTEQRPIIAVIQNWIAEFEE
jgi:Tol biopolymer transport system component